MLKREQQLTALIFGICLFAGAIFPVTAFTQESKNESNDFIIGTETFSPEPFISMDDLTLDTIKIGQIEDVINNVLQTNHVKYRMDQFMVVKDTFGNFLPCLYIIDPTTHRPDTSKGYIFVDQIASIFIRNGWTMYPLFSQQNQYSMDFRRTMTTEIMAEYVAWIDWFLDRYTQNDVIWDGQNYGRIQVGYIEAGNNPANNWYNLSQPDDPGNPYATYEQLVEQQNMVYDTIKTKYPDMVITSPGFEFHHDTGDPDDWAINLLEYFLDSANGAWYDALAIHTYSLRPDASPSLFVFFPPTKMAHYNLYGNVAGLLELRQRLNQSGWQDREIIATEHWLELGGGPLSPGNDELWTVLNVQFNLLRATLKQNGASVLSGFNNMLIIHKSTMGPAVQGSLTPDGQPTQHVEATAFLWEKLREYDHDSRVSGKFDAHDTVWVEKFKTGDDELYVFFKPFFWPDETQPIQFDGQTLSWTVNFGMEAVQVSLYDMFGNLLGQWQNVDSVTVQAENKPQYLEVGFDYTSIKDNTENVPQEFSLYQNHPNPFNPKTVISFQLSVFSKVTLKIYNMLGQEVWAMINENKPAGSHSVVWNGTDNSDRQVSSGVYFYSLELGNNYSITKKLLLIK